VPTLLPRTRAQDFDISALPKAARSLLTIPLLLAEGVWGDGSAPQSVVALAAADNTPGVMIIPSVLAAASSAAKPCPCAGPNTCAARPLARGWRGDRSSRRQPCSPA